MGTRYVADLHRENAAPLVCFVEGSEPDARDLYLGEDHPDHTARLCDGRVWVNGDPTLLKDCWREIK